MNLYYQNGSFSGRNDNLTREIIEQPFWDFLQNEPGFKNIESEMRKAKEEFDIGDYSEASRHALMAFESSMKVKLDSNEHFAQLIDKEEKLKGYHRQFLKDLNSKFRNKASHGSGKGKRSKVNREEAALVLGISMIYIKYILID